MYTKSAYPINLMAGDGKQVLMGGQVWSGQLVCGLG